MSERLAFVCLGNICRSPMADVVMQSKVDAAGLDWTIASSGTGDWHTGGPMDRRAAKTLRSAGYDPSRHRARHFTASWFDDFDVILTMDAQNHSDVLALASNDADRDKVAMFRSFDPESTGPDDLEVPDPWYGGEQGFHDVLDMVERTTNRIIDLRSLR